MVKNIQQRRVQKTKRGKIKSGEKQNDMPVQLLVEGQLFRIFPGSLDLIQEYLTDKDISSLALTCRSAYDKLVTGAIWRHNQLAPTELPLILRQEKTFFPPTADDGPFAAFDTGSYKFFFLVQTLVATKSLQRWNRQRELRPKNHQVCNGFGSRLKIKVSVIEKVQQLDEFDFEQYLCISAVIYKKSSKARKWTIFEDNPKNGSLAYDATITCILRAINGVKPLDPNEYEQNHALVCVGMQTSEHYEGFGTHFHIHGHENLFRWQRSVDGNGASVER